MKFTDNPEITAANMAASDILAGTDTSAAADRKFTLSGLATWALSIFDGLSLAGAAQTVKAALDGLASRLTTVEAGTNTISKYTVETYTGTTLAGTAQTVKAAVDGLVATGSAQVPLSMGGYSATATVFKRAGGCVELTFPDGAGTAFATFTTGGQVGTLPAGFRPSHTIYATGIVRSGWSAVYPIIVRIGNDGTISVYGNQTNVRSCSYIMVTAEFHV